MAQQTAVDWLIKNLPEDYILALPYELVEQAKKMERQQKKYAWVDGNGTQMCITSKEEDECFDDYYEITYGK